MNRFLDKLLVSLISLIKAIHFYERPVTATLSKDIFSLGPKLSSVEGNVSFDHLAKLTSFSRC